VNASTATSRSRTLSPTTRRVVLTTHIAASVGLLGDVSAFLAVAIRAAGSGDPGFAGASYDLLAMFSVLFGIPLSFTALLTGVTLGLGSKWGVFRYPWVTAKLLLILSVILVGALVIGPTLEQLRSGDGGSEARLITAATWDVLALLTATVLSVFKPGRARRGG
jgi:hypothetical protein